MSDCPKCAELQLRLSEASLSAPEAYHRWQGATALLSEQQAELSKHCDCLFTENGKPEKECAFHSSREYHAKRELERRDAYAAAIEAPAIELLYLYDWRPQLAMLEEEARTNEESREVKRLLREYGERKKAGWIALRAALAKLGDRDIEGIKQAPDAQGKEGGDRASFDKGALTVSLPRAVLEHIQWAAGGDCPNCGAWGPGVNLHASGQHTPSCEIGAALRGTCEVPPQRGPEPAWMHADMCDVEFGGACNCFVTARRAAWLKGEWPPKIESSTERHDG